jgi:hypothetical protein
MTKREREEYVIARAYELADSGNYRVWRYIELELIHEGFNEARRVLDDSVTRQLLDERCADAQSRKPNA